MEVIILNLEEECRKALNLGISIRFLADKMHRDPTTLSKWLRGERNISDDIKNDLILVLQELKEQWNNIMKE